jgi:hypothetical protein
VAQAEVEVFFDAGLSRRAMGLLASTLSTDTRCELVSAAIRPLSAFCVLLSFSIARAQSLGRATLAVCTSMTGALGWVATTGK